MKKDNLFKNKNFTLVFLGALVSNIGNLIYSFAVSFYILKISNNNSIIQGLYLALCGITFCLVSLFGGVLGDRYNKAKIMYISDYAKGITLALSNLLMLLVFKTNESQIIMLFIMGFLGNFIAAIFSPASSGILPLIVEKEDLQKANSYFSLLNSFQSIIGVMLAGILYSIMNVYELLFIVSICFILSGVSEMFIKYNCKESDNKLSINTIFRDIKDGFIYIAKNKTILSLILTCLFLNFFFSPIFSNFIPYFISKDIAVTDYMFKDILNSPEMFSSIFEILFGFGSIISGIYFTKKNIDKAHKIVSISLMSCSLILLIYSFVYFYGIKNNNINIIILFTMIVTLLIGLLLVGVNVPINTTIYKKTEEDMLSKVNGTINIGSQGLIPLSSFLAGVVLNFLGEFTLLISCSIGFLVICITFIFNKNAKQI